MENTNANALDAVKQPSDNKQKQIHLPGELPGQKASPVEQNKKPILEIKGLTKNFANFTAVNNVDLTIYEGEIFALLGSSGCGKSTLLSILSGLVSDYNGVIKSDKSIGYMLQTDCLLPWLTIRDNALLGL